MLPDQIQSQLLLLPALILSLTIHEFAHARTALAFGDPTARDLGRCSLNPMVHLDLMGLLCLVFAGFGWAKPVPINPYNLHPPKLGNIMVSLAGPMSNAMLALATALVLRVLLSTGGLDILGDHYLMVFRLMLMFMSINVLLAIFNMIPLFPLDGHHILREQLPSGQQQAFMDWQMRYGRFALIGLMFLPFFAPQLSPVRFMSRHAQDFLWLHVILPQGSTEQLLGPAVEDPAAEQDLQEPVLPDPPATGAADQAQAEDRPDTASSENPATQTQKLQGD